MYAHISGILSNKFPFEGIGQTRGRQINDIHVCSKKKERKKMMPTHFFDKSGESCFSSTFRGDR